MALILNKEEAEMLVEAISNTLCEREEVKAMTIAEASAFELGVRSVQLGFRKKMEDYI